MGMFVSMFKRIKFGQNCMTNPIKTSPSWFRNQPGPVWAATVWALKKPVRTSFPNWPIWFWLIVGQAWPHYYNDTEYVFTTATEKPAA
jgi:hypothetical protein